MTLETDLLIDRRRLKRRLIFWQSLAILAVVAAVLAGLRGGGIGGRGAHVERVRVSGIILDDPKLERAIRKLAKEPSVKAVVVSIDSPGGSVAGGESIHDAIAS